MRVRVVTYRICENQKCPYKAQSNGAHGSLDWAPRTRGKTIGREIHGRGGPCKTPAPGGCLQALVDQFAVVHYESALHGTSKRLSNAGVGSLRHICIPWCPGAIGTLPLPDLRWLGALAPDFVLFDFEGHMLTTRVCMHKGTPQYVCTHKGKLK